MKTIEKYLLMPMVTLNMPQGAQVLSVHARNEKMYLWALVDASAESEPRKFMVYGTGQSVPEEHERPGVKLGFIGTLFMDRLELDFHVFEVLSEVEKATI